jgi:hypothetical protein
MRKIASGLATIIFFPLLVMANIFSIIVYVFKKDNEQAILQGIGKGYTEEDLKEKEEE